MKGFNAIGNYGQLIRLDPADPAVGNDLIVTVPADVVWIPCSISYNVSTGVGAATRRAMIIINWAGGGDHKVQIASDQTQAASLFRAYSWHPQTPLLGTTFNSTFDVQCNLPYPLFLVPGDVISLNLDQKQAVDQIAACHLLFQQYANI